MSGRVEMRVTQQPSESSLSGVVFFDEENPTKRPQAERHVQELYRERLSDPATIGDSAPDFIGSLQHHFYPAQQLRNINRLDYAGYPAYVNGQEQG